MERNYSNPISAGSATRKLAMVALITLSSLITAQAGDHLPGDKNKLVSITSLGIANGEMAFNIKYENAAEDRVALTLTDSEGFVLYKEIVTAKGIDKTFKTTSDVGTVVLTITNLKDKAVHKYSITNEKRVVEELAIVNIR